MFGVVLKQLHITFIHMKARNRRIVALLLLRELFSIFPVLCFNETFQIAVVDIGRTVFCVNLFVQHNGLVIFAGAHVFAGKQFLFRFLGKSRNKSKQQYEKN